MSRGRTEIEMAREALLELSDEHSNFLRLIRSLDEHSFLRGLLSKADFEYYAGASLGDAISMRRRLDLILEKVYQEE